MVVRVKDAGVKLAGKWCFVNDIAEIDEQEYLKNREYVEVIDGNSSKGLGNEDTLTELRTKAKELGIKNVHNMKKETLILKLSEAANTATNL